MCGFAGVIAWDERYRVSRETLGRMSATIAHRGPDGEGYNIEGDATADRPQVALAFRRLAILDPDPRSNQPFTDGQHWLVFNGEIYNFRELREELSKLDRSYAWRTTGDTEVLLRSYAQWGKKCVEHLNGMFAFAVWDGQEKSLFLARDRMGQKPLYVSFSRNVQSDWGYGASFAAPVSVAFASELSALREVAWVDTTLHADAVSMYLSLGYLPDTTIYNGVVKLQAATCFTIRDGGAYKQHYFRAYADISDSSQINVAAAPCTRELVSAAVRRQLVADVPLGCFLSGGIDSSIVASAMRASVPASQPVLTFSIGFDDPRYDETAYAARVAAHLRTEHHQFTVRPNAAEDLPRLATVYGEPFADSSALPTHYLARETRNWVKVALSGDGGDELFGGYDRYRAMAIGERMSGLGWRSAVSLARPFLAAVGSTHPKSRSARFRRFLESAHLPPGDRYASYVRLFDPKTIAALLGHDVSSPPQYDQLPQMFATGLAVRPMVPNALAVDRITYLAEDLLTKVDRASMLHALEVRSPFMDPDVVTFAAGLTTDQLLKGGPKRMLREAFAADLPDFVFKRRKMGFAVPIGDWFRGELRPMLRDHLFAADSFARQHFDVATVERLVEEHEQSRVDHSQRLYALLMLELWHHIQKPRP
jgi:asparagine synthase (glutamine-hydrolysing)